MRMNNDGRDDHIHVELPSGGIARVSPDASPKLLKALDNLCRLAAKQEIGNMRIVVDCVVMREPGEGRPIKIRVKNSRAFSGDIIYFGGALPLGPAQLVIRSGTEMRDQCPACFASGTVGDMNGIDKGSECPECKGTGEIKRAGNTNFDLTETKRPATTGEMMGEK